MAKRDFKEYICRPFCKFFREGEKEEMACQAARVIEEMVSCKQLEPNLLPRNGKEPSLWREFHPLLVARICQKCPFREKDCDYQSPVPSADAEPCGGYVLLSLLIRRGVISRRDLGEQPD